MIPVYLPYSTKKPVYVLVHQPLSDIKNLVGGGFEPPKAEPTDLQSVPFDHSGTPPSFKFYVTTLNLHHISKILNKPENGLEPPTG